MGCTVGGLFACDFAGVTVVVFCVLFIVFLVVVTLVSVVGAGWVPVTLCCWFVLVVGF